MEIAAAAAAAVVVTNQIGSRCNQIVDITDVTAV